MRAAPLSPLPQLVSDSSQRIGLVWSTIPLWLLVQTQTKCALYKYARLLSRIRGCYTHTDTKAHRHTKTFSLSPHPSLSGLTMFRTFGNYDDKLTVLGVQVLQVEEGLGNDHTWALMYSDRLQHHLWGLIVLPLHRSQRHTVKKGNWPRGKDCCPPEWNASSQMTVLVLIYPLMG